jgi:hypothetical protein
MRKSVTRRRLNARCDAFVRLSTVKNADREHASRHGARRSDQRHAHRMHDPSALLVRPSIRRLAAALTCSVRDPDVNDRLRCTYVFCAAETTHVHNDQRLWDASAHTRTHARVSRPMRRVDARCSEWIASVALAL